VVARSESRWLLHVTADHTDAQIDRLVQAAIEARESLLTPSRGDRMAGRNDMKH